MNILKILFGKFCAFAWRRIYIIGQETYCVAYNDITDTGIANTEASSVYRLEAVTETTPKPWLSIYLPRYYFESNEVLPVESYSEANGIAQNLPSQAPVPGHQVVLVKETELANQQVQYMANTATITSKKLTNSLWHVPLAWLVTQHPGLYR